MAKRLTDQQKEEIVKLFISGDSIEKISHQFNCTKLTISRNLKINLGEATYKELSLKNKSNNKLIKNKNQRNNQLSNKSKKNLKTNKDDLKKILNEDTAEEFLEMSEFVEIAPLNDGINISSQKDFASIPIAEVEFPKVVYMIVDNKVELEIKCLKEYSKWEFLSPDELERKTIEIYSDLKIAKGFCNKEQKVIKVTNTDVFKKVTSILLSRGISRIVSSDKLIAL